MKAWGKEFLGVAHVVIRLAGFSFISGQRCGRHLIAFTMTYRNEKCHLITRLTTIKRELDKRPHTTVGSLVRHSRSRSETIKNVFWIAINLHPFAFTFTNGTSINRRDGIRIEYSWGSVKCKFSRFRLSNFLSAHPLYSRADKIMKVEERWLLKPPAVAPTLRATFCEAFNQQYRVPPRLA